MKLKKKEKLFISVGPKKINLKVLLDFSYVLLNILLVVFCYIVEAVKYLMCVKKSLYSFKCNVLEILYVHTYIFEAE